MGQGGADGAGESANTLRLPQPPEIGSLRIAFVGNFLPHFVPTPTAPTPYSTEVHLGLSLEALGHTVLRLQEGEVRAANVTQAAQGFGADLFIWTQTLGLADTGGTISERAAMLEDLRSAGIPSLGVHLDRWWGLERERSVYEQPYFRVDLLASADGGHDAEWAAAGVNHVWSPPAIYHGEAVTGTYRPEYASPIAFVGSWHHYAHEAWPHRRQLIDHLRMRWGRQTKFWPMRGAVRGAALSDLYASVSVIVGDSCLVPNSDGSPCTHYISDRCPETMGRTTSAALVHPRVEGVTDGTLWQEGEHLACWALGDWDELDATIQRLLDNESERRALAGAGYAHTVSHHTYVERFRRLLPVALRESHPLALSARQEAVPA
ncbi:MAG: glycosyltransferase [Candidatus Dormibacteria bacterium]